MTEKDVVQITARIPNELKELVDADNRTNQDVVEAALWREFGGHRKSALERRIAEHDRRIDIIENEVGSRESELEEQRMKRETLKEQLEEKRSTQESVLADAEEWFRPGMGPTNEAVRKHADRASMTPNQFIKEMERRLDR